MKASINVEETEKPAPKIKLATAGLEEFNNIAVGMMIIPMKISIKAGYKN